jgi:hypothetical protein
MNFSVKIISFSDEFIEQQVWKTQIDLTIFQDLMSECSDLDVKTRYIKFKHHTSIAESGDSEQGEIDGATGGEATADENDVEQIFLETTV